MDIHIKIDKLIRSDRTTLTFQIYPNGELIVRAPIKMPLTEINKYLLEKEKWILKKQEVAKIRTDHLKQIKYENGELFLLKGKTYPLQFIDNYEHAMVFKNNTFIINSDLKKYAVNVFEQWYKLYAKRHIVPRAFELSKLSGIKFNNIRINSAKTRWGSCSGKATINFSWRLVLAPEFVIDYVIIHELAHIIELNHSSKFWDLVSKMYPEYKTAEKWLDEQGYLANL